MLYGKQLSSINSIYHHVHIKPVDYIRPQHDPEFEFLKTQSKAKVPSVTHMTAEKKEKTPMIQVTGGKRNV